MALIKAQEGGRWLFEFFDGRPRALIELPLSQSLLQVISAAGIVAPTTVTFLRSLTDWCYDDNGSEQASDGAGFRCVTSRRADNVTLYSAIGELGDDFYFCVQWSCASIETQWTQWLAVLLLLQHELRDLSMRQGLDLLQCLKPDNTSPNWVDQPFITTLHESLRQWFFVDELVLEIPSNLDSGQLDTTEYITRAGMNYAVCANGHQIEFRQQHTLVATLKSATPLRRLANPLSDLILAHIAQSLTFILLTRKEQAESIEQHSRLSAVLQATDIGTWEWDLAQGVIKLDEPWANMIGYRLDELSPVTAARWLEFAHPDDQHRCQQALREHLQQLTPQIELQYRMKHRDGHWVWVQDRGRVLSWLADGRPHKMYGSHINITTQKEAERQLQQSRDQFYSLVESIPGVTYRARPQQPRELLFISDQCLSVLGIEAGDLLRQQTSLLAWIHPDDVARYELEVDAAVHTGMGWSLDYRLIDISGSAIWVHERGRAHYDEQGLAVYLEGFILDVSSEIEAQMLIQRQVQALTALSEIASNTALDLDAQIHGALALACQHLLMNAGYVAIKRRDSFQIQWLINENNPTLQLGKTISTENSLAAELFECSDVVACEQVWCSPLRECVEYQQHELESVIGSALQVDAKDVGVIVFVAPEVRERVFDNSDKMFVRLVGRWIASLLEQRHSEMQLLKLTQQVPGMVYQYRRWPSGRHIFPYCSAGVDALLGLAPNDLSQDATAFFKQIEPSDLQGFMAAIDLSATSLQEWRYQFRLNDSKLSLRWLEGQAMPEAMDDGSVLWHGFIRDITTQKLTELELHDNEARLRSLFALSPVGIVLTDLANATILDANQSIAQITQYPTDTLHNLSWHQILATTHHGQLDTIRTQLLEQGRYGPLDLELLRADGQLCPVAIAGIRITDSHGRELVWTIVEDISQRKQTEQALRHAKDLAETTAQLKSMFLANMSHEIRTPMNGLLGMLDLLSRSALSTRQLHQLTVAIRSGQSLLAIINDILDFSKIDAGKLSLECVRFDLVQLIQDCETTFRLACEQKDLQFVLALPTSFPQWVHGDPYRIRQVLNNLLNNAVKFTEHGAITLTFTVHQHQHQLWCEFAIADTGIGIAEEHQTQLFSAFMQADSSTTRRFGGTGLGLAISHQLVQLMDGDIRVDSQLNHGSTFYVRLRLQLASEPSSVDAPSQLNTALYQGTVLLVEDNPINAEVAIMMLAELGLHTLHVWNGREAIEHLQRAHQPYCIIFMDCLMPILDGYRCTQAIRAGEAGERWQTIPVVALTANAFNEERAKCVASGMTDYLSKPLQINTLSSLLARYLTSQIPVDITSSSPDIATLAVESNAPMQHEDMLWWDEAALLRSLGAMAQMKTRLLTMFCDQHEQTAHHITNAWHSGDIDQVRALLHRIKGASGQLCCFELQQAAADGEQQLAQGDKEAIDCALKKFIKALEATLQTLKNST